MCITVPPHRPVSCKDQQSYAMKTLLGSWICAHRATATFNQGDLKTLAYVVDSSHIVCISKHAEVPCLAEWIENSIPKYRSLGFALAPAVAPTVKSKVVERLDGSFVLGFPLDGVYSTEGLAVACIRSLLHNEESTGLQTALFGEAFDPPQTDADFDSIFQADAVVAFCAELLEALLSKWKPGCDLGLVFVVPAVGATKESAPHGDGHQKRQRVDDVMISLQITLVFELPRGARTMPILGLQHNHPAVSAAPTAAAAVRSYHELPTWRAPDDDAYWDAQLEATSNSASAAANDKHLFLTNCPGLAKHLRVSLKLKQHCGLELEDQVKIASEISRVHSTIVEGAEDGGVVDPGITCWNLTNLGDDSDVTSFKCSDHATQQTPADHASLIQRLYRGFAVRLRMITLSQFNVADPVDDSLWEPVAHLGQDQACDTSTHPGRQRYNLETMRLHIAQPVHPHTFMHEPLLTTSMRRSVEEDRGGNQVVKASAKAVRYATVLDPYFP